MLTPDEVESAAVRLVERTCRTQGLPVVATDPAVLRRVAAILSPARDEAPAGARANATTDLPDATSRKVCHERT